jgi:hypothetical protein
MSSVLLSITCAAPAGFEVDPPGVAVNYWLDWLAPLPIATLVGMGVSIGVSTAFGMGVRVGVGTAVGLGVGVDVGVSAGVSVGRLATVYGAVAGASVPLVALTVYALPGRFGTSKQAQLPSGSSFDVRVATVSIVPTPVSCSMVNAIGSLKLKTVRSEASLIITLAFALNGGLLCLGS